MAKQSKSRSNSLRPRPRREPPGPATSQRPVLAVLKALRDGALGGSRVLSTFDVWRSASAVLAPAAVDMEAVEGILHQLSHLGLVKSVSPTDALESAASGLWEASPGWVHDIKAGVDGGGLDRGAQGDDYGRRRRFPEVLAHPSLFALPSEDFEALLEQVLSE